MSSITDIAYINGQVYVAGLSNEEFASNLRAIQYPFEKVSPGSSIEIYHGAHGAFETRSPGTDFCSLSNRWRNQLARRLYLYAARSNPFDRDEGKKEKSKEPRSRNWVTEIAHSTWSFTKKTVKILS